MEKTEAENSYILTGQEALTLGLQALRGGNYDRAKLLVSNCHLDTREARLAEIRLIKEIPEALKACRDLLKDYPEDPETLARLSALLGSIKDTKDAKKVLAKLSGASVDDGFFWLDLGFTLYWTKEYDQAMPCVLRAFSYEKDWLEAWQLKGLIEMRMGEPNKAIRSFHRVLSYAGQHQATFLHLAICYNRLAKYDLSKSFQELAESTGPYEARLKLMEAHRELMTRDLAVGFDLYRVRHETENSPKEMREGPDKLKSMLPDLAGKTIRVLLEQGSGDCIQFCRFVPELLEKGADVTLQCSPALAPLFSESFPAAEICTKVDNGRSYDVELSVIDLPYALGMRSNDIPLSDNYLKTAQDRVEKWREKFAGLNGFKVGFSWHGSAGHGNDALRSMTLEDLQPLFKYEDIEWVSLQVNNKDKLTGFENVHDFTADVKDFADTAAIIQEVDLVISIDSSPIHLAGALGQPVWAMLALNPDWRWRLKRDDTDWYQSVRLFRQTGFKDWSTVVKKISKALELHRA